MGVFVNKGNNKKHLGTDRVVCRFLLQIEILRSR